MDSTTDASSTPADRAADPSGPRPGRGRGRGRGGMARSGEDGHGFAPRGRGRGGNRGRGRGGRDGDNTTDRTAASQRNSGKAPVVEPSDTQPQPAPPSAPVDAEDNDGEVCFICASNIQHTAVTPCNHRTCHICSLRLRALYKVKTCAHCRTESDYVIFTDNHTKNYEEFSKNDFFKTLDSIGIHFENQEILADTELVLRYNCPDSTCDVACLGWHDLNRHVQTAHGKKMCDLCTRNKKVFTHEHELFTQAELNKHKKFGDDNPGAVDQSGFKGHPECGFCRQRFYGDDELYTHCRDKHERCHICDRRSEGRHQQYFADYNSLEQHFRKDHFLCPDGECLEKKFVVFDSELDLKAHQLEVHPNGLSKDALRDARRVDMSGFQLRTSHEQESGGRRGRGRGGREGGRGRGRDPNAEPLPASSAQPLSRAELAFQRQMAVQNTQSGVGRSFGGQLTSTPTPSEAFAARPSASPAPPTVTASRPRGPAPGPTPTNNNADGDNRQTESNVPRTPQEQARILRHNAVMERASNLLRNDQSKLSDFRSQISDYRNSKTTAAELIENFFLLFDTKPAELGKLIKELADIFEVAPKRDSLLKAWSDWKAIHEDYPSLPGAAAGLSLGSGSGSGGYVGSRVLKLKSATAQSSRSAINKQASWSTTSSSLFPALPKAGSASAAGRIGAKPGQTPWASSSGSSGRAPAAGPSQATPSGSGAASTAATNQRQQGGSLADAFPALPAAPKPTTTIFSPGYSGAGLRRDNSGRNITTNNPWVANSGSGSNTPAAAPADEGSGAGGKKKGNKNKKQTLFHFG